MIVYLDTSSLVKLYVEEEESPAISDLVQSSQITATSVVAYAEARTAFARRFREKAFKPKDYERIKSFLDQDWPKYFILNATDNLIKFSGDLAEKHALRGFDAIHLASAVTLRLELSSPILFSCFDNNLSRAYKREEAKQNG